MKYDLIIIGAGPAGMTAAIYAARAKLKVAIIEKDTPGGKMVKTSFIENWPGDIKISGTDLSMNMFNQIMNLKVDYLYGNVLDIKKSGSLFNVATDSESHQALKIIIATGTKEKKMGIPGEEQFYGKGISYCAVCDGALYQDQIMTVIGGGNSAVEEALYLTKFAKLVYVIHRRGEFRADEMLVSLMEKNPKIKVITNTIPLQIRGSQVVTSIEVKNVLTEETYDIETNVIFPFIGSSPENDFINNLKIKNDLGYIVVNDNFETSRKNIFAIGDVIKKSLRQIITAASDGASAANYIAKEINTKK